MTCDDVLVGQVQLWRRRADAEANYDANAKETTMSSMKGFMIGALAVGVGVLGYLYYQETRNNIAVKIQLPKVEIQKN